ncbi:hypothetical protein, partial [Streptomyces sp. NPDC006333]|uniref:hypothetical protein n=1 Tax=Streptomyces sp. NPDC006333 TaxID=3156753 RepID=UPI0033BB1743
FARAERERIAATEEVKRQNLVRIFASAADRLLLYENATRRSRVRCSGGVQESSAHGVSVQCGAR